MTLRRWMSLSLMTLIVTSTALAQDAKLRRLDSGVQASAWEAVGRLDLGGEGFCTGALIAPDQVLTAAHCLYDKATGEQIDTTRVEFRAGWRNGRASAYRNVRRAVVHPDYTYQGELNAGDVRNDLAILELEMPIRNGRIEPFQTATLPGEGARVGVVSYAKTRSDAPSLQEVCTILTKREGVLVTSCTADFGASGAPIFVFGDGKAQIVSVVSAKAEMGGVDVSLGTSLDVPLERLKAEYASGSARFGESGTIRRIGASDDNARSGAKFVRP